MWRDADEKGGLNLKRGEGCARGGPLRRDSFSNHGDVHVAFKMMTRNSTERRITSQRPQGMRRLSCSLEDETVPISCIDKKPRIVAHVRSVPIAEPSKAAMNGCVNKVPTWLKCAVRWPLSYIGAANVDEPRFNQQVSIDSCQHHLASLRLLLHACCHCLAKQRC